MARTEDGVPSTSDLNEAESGKTNDQYKNSHDLTSLVHNNIRMRKNMAALQRVPIKIENDKLLDAHVPRYNEDSLERFCPSNRMPRMYAHFGYFVGLHPLKSFLFGLLIAFLSFGMFYVRLQDNVRDGYTPSTSRARKESDNLRSFMNSTSKL